MRMIIKYLIAVLFVPVADAGQDSNYEKLHEFFFEWRSFESPPLREGAPAVSYTHLTLPTKA